MKQERLLRAGAASEAQGEWQAGESVRAPADFDVLKAWKGSQGNSDTLIP